MHRALGMASGAEASKFSLAPAIDGALGHHAARRISGAQEQDVVFTIGHGAIVRRGFVRYCAFDAEQQALSKTGPARSTNQTLAVWMRPDAGRRRCRTPCSHRTCETFPTKCRSDRTPSLCCRARSSTPRFPASRPTARGVEPFAIAPGLHPIRPAAEMIEARQVDPAVIAKLTRGSSSIHFA